MNNPLIQNKFEIKKMLELWRIVLDYESYSDLCYKHSHDVCKVDDRC